MSRAWFHGGLVSTGQDPTGRIIPGPSAGPLNTWIYPPLFFSPLFLPFLPTVIFFFFLCGPQGLRCLGSALLLTSTLGSWCLETGLSLHCPGWPEIPDLEPPKHQDPTHTTVPAWCHLHPVASATNRAALEGSGRAVKLSV